MAATFLAFRKEIWGPLPKRRALGLRCGGRILGREKRWLLGQSVARSVGQVAMLNARITTCGRARPGAAGGRAGGRPRRRWSWNPLICITTGAAAAAAFANRKSFEQSDRATATERLRRQVECAQFMSVQRGRSVGRSVGRPVSSDEAKFHRELPEAPDHRVCNAHITEQGGNG